jgi:hypothetical protein
MLKVTQSVHTPVSNETGLLKRKWKSIRFLLAKRAFESKLESILTAVAGHEENSLAAGNQQYQLLHAEADSLCKDFADRWDLKVELVKARIAGLTRLERLSAPTQTLNYARLACLGVIAMPLFLFLLGAMAGLVNVGFHLVGGR